MKTELIHMLIAFGGIFVGTIIGYGFGALQSAALLQHKKLQESGKFKSGWSILPSSMQRTALLLAVLALIQVACPMFFEDNTIPWLVSAGVVLGYGYTLYEQLRKREVYR